MITRAPCSRLLRSLLAGLLCCCLAGWVQAQSLFFESAESSSEFSPVVPGVPLVFPQDHGAHPNFRLEWWYLTANLRDDQGREWGMQWTLFRQALDASAQVSGWSNNQMWMAHAAITAPDGHQFEQRFSRGGIGQAGVELREPGFRAWIDDWSWTSEDSNMLPAELNFTVHELQIRLDLTRSGPFVRQGELGYSQKSAGNQASYYYSLPFIEIDAQVVRGADTIRLQGQGWLDREWSSEPLSDQQTGWDWFSLHLDQDEKLMVYRLRDLSGDHWLKGTFVDAQGEVHDLKKSQINLTELERRPVIFGDGSEAPLPLNWRIELPDHNREIVVRPLYDQQWMATAISYWEGVMIARDAQGQVIGRGYMELTGYD